MEIEAEKTKLDDIFRNSLRNRSLPFLSSNYPSNEKVKEQVVRRPIIDINPTKHRDNTPVKETEKERGAPRRIPRPKSMLRPKVCYKRPRPIVLIPRFEMTFSTYDLHTADREISRGFCDASSCGKQA